MNKVLAYPCRKILRKTMPAHGISFQVWNELQALFALLMSWTYTLHKDLRAHQNTKYNLKTKYPLAKQFELTKKLLPPIFPNIFQRFL